VRGGCRFVLYRGWRGRRAGFATTLTVRVDQLAAFDKDKVNVALTFTFTDPTLPMPRSDDGVTRQTGESWDVVRTATGWQVSRYSYCQILASLGLPYGLRLAC